jgi:hypothetical protein
MAETAAKARKKKAANREQPKTKAKSRQGDEGDR